MLIKARYAPELAMLNGEITNDAALKTIILALPFFTGHKVFPAAELPAPAPLPPVAALPPPATATAATTTARPLQPDPG